MKTFRWNDARTAHVRRHRRGVIVVLAAAAMILIMGFAAFSVDVGYIALTRNQLQAGADSSALAANQDLPPGLTPGATATAFEVATDARNTAVDMAARHKAGDKLAIYCDGSRDVRLGQVIWNPGTNSWQKTWGVSPYNAVEVTLRRDQGSGGNDGPLPLFFAPVIGNQEAKLSVKAISAVVPANGFRIIPGTGVNPGILPITLDDVTWEDLLDHPANYQDEFTFVESTGAVVPGPDGVHEVNLYPNGLASTAPGNRGTVDFGDSGNSTNDIKRQILYGLNEDDLAALGFELSFDDGPLLINGDTGISAAIKAELEQIMGEPRAIPIFTGLPQGNGNNAMYTITKFVGIRIVEVKLTGNPKRVIIQPAPYVDPTATKDTTGTSVADATVFTTATLIE